MWYFAKVEPIPGAERMLRTELMWGEAALPKCMIGWVAADGQSAFVLLDCNSDPAHSGELEDLRRYFNVIEVSSAEPFFIGEHARHSFRGGQLAALAGLSSRNEVGA